MADLPTKDAESRQRRDYFIGQALAGLNANPQLLHVGTDILAAWSIEQADAILTALNKEEKPEQEWTGEVNRW